MKFASTIFPIFLVLSPSCSFRVKKQHARNVMGRVNTPEGSDNFTGDEIPGAMSDDVPLCEYPAMDNCAVSSAPDGGIFDVKPGGRTSCIEGDYKFRVRVADPRKLHIHFMGGGACWNALPACERGPTLKHPQFSEGWGVWDPTNPMNGLSNHSFIVVSYCSGDLHIGDTDMRYAFWMPKVKVRGWPNALSALNYGLNNFGDLDQLTISGLSAGAMAVQFLSAKVIDMFSDKVSESDVVVIADSFIGMDNPEFKTMSDRKIKSSSFRNIAKKWGGCNPQFMSDSDVNACQNAEIVPADVWENTMASYPETKFVSTASKSDAVQKMFYGLLVSSNITQDDFYKAIALQTKRWMKNPNFFSYLVQSTTHTYMAKDILTTAPEGIGEKGGESMIEWLSNIVKPTKRAAARDVCAGPRIDLTEDTDVAGKGISYCAK